MASTSSSSPRDRDATPWLLVAAAATVLAIVAGVVAIALTDSYWWVAAVVALVCAGAVGSSVGVVELTDRRRQLRARALAVGTAPGGAPGWRGPQGSPHVLVVASEPVGRELLDDGLGRAMPPGAAALVVAPAYTRTRLRYWVSDLDDAIDRARAVEEESVAALRSAGVAADGHVGSGDPLTAIEDALRFFDPELIVLLLHRPGRRRYRERPLRDEVERRFNRPVEELAPSATTTSRRSA